MSSDRRLRALACALAALLVATSAAAAPADPRREAQELFDGGLALLDAGELERALAHFQRSRAITPSKGNTANAAHCLHELGRYDEALELYEELVARFAAELGPDNRRRLVPAMQELARRVGSLVVSSNVGGTIVVDGRPRGTLPATVPIRLLGGPHLVRVIQDGYAAFERRVDVAVGATVAIDAVLAPLAASGRLRVEDPDAPGARVFVDRVEVGAAPWEGTLGPGPHVVYTRGAGRGSAPARAVVIQGQTATLRVRSAELGPPTTLAAEPGTADLALDGVELGPGAWTGPLPAGPHELRASEPGYVTRAVRFVEPAAGAAPDRLTVTLDVDPTHPRWPARTVGHVELEAFTGVAVGPGLGGDASAWCAGGCSSGPGAVGAIAGARLGWRFAFGGSIALAAAYVGLGSTFERTRTSSFRSGGATVPITYTLRDEVRVRGALVAGAVGWRAPIGSVLGVGARLTAGVLIASTSDPITGTASTAGGSAAVLVTDRGERLRSTALFLEPEVGLDARLGALRVGAGVGLGAVIGAGPTFQHALLQVDPAGCSPARPTAAACAPASRAVADERAYRTFAVVLPTLTVGYAF